MSLPEIVLADLGLAGAALLLIAAVRRWTGAAVRLPEALARHRVLPGAAAGFGWFAEVAEVVAGATVVVAWLAGWPAGMRAGSAGMSVMYALFAVYLTAVLRRNGRVPCLCLDRDTTVSGATIMRAVALSLASSALALGLAAPPHTLLDRLVHLPGAALVALLLVVLVEVTGALRAAQPRVGR
ncbi:hypothetical protein QLQ12_31000 [Actinoplanes sp. NEAU-A12]|uniref:Methylamine utilisation protein MauE domain-containing protein n=1 Tax=Actinoplanes sandaracinus TaxID=3045177 RepID=A0ABT6WTG8_9ACTN|nr:MauE/DoxX family redox-associated membrane protein [Actinoplanes sandaracinus]MDI6103052.1 hypothetical protein [Actinoplanes sandaracinus]